MFQLLASLAVAVGLAVTLTAPAQASSKAESSALPGGAAIHVQSGLCLDGSISQGIRLNACNGGEYQNWKVALRDGSTSPTRFTLIHEQSGKCLDGSVSQGVLLKGCNLYSFHQVWIYDGRTFRSRVSPEKCLDGSRSQGVRLNDCRSGNTYQQWIW